MIRFTIASLLFAAAPVRVPSQVTVIKDVEYARVGGRRLQLDLYLPPASQRPAPVVVWMHWGGWRSGHRANAGPDATDLASRGLAVAAIDYRLSGEAAWPAQIHDCKGAVRFLRANAGTWGLDGDRFGAFGFSSGGHLAAMLGTTGGVASLEGQIGGNLRESSRVQFAADLSGPTDLLGPAVYEPADSIASELIGKSIGEIKQHINNPEYAQWVELARSANPARYVTRDDPPFYIAHGTNDTQVPESQGKLLHVALDAAGVENVYDAVDAGHNLPQLVWNLRRDQLLRWLLTDVGFRVYGKGCSGPGSDEPAIGAIGTPERGKRFSLTLTSGPATKPVAAMFCVRRTRVPLDALGATGCAFLVIDPVLLHLDVTDSAGNVSVRLPLPTSLPPGIVVWTQWAALDPAANRLGWVMSNAARIRID